MNFSQLELAVRQAMQAPAPALAAVGGNSGLLPEEFHRAVNTLAQRSNSTKASQLLSNLAREWA